MMEITMNSNCLPGYAPTTSSHRGARLLAALRLWGTRLIAVMLATLLIATMWYGETWLLAEAPGATLEYAIATTPIPTSTHN
jgi:hypothetical protein